MWHIPNVVESEVFAIRRKPHAHRPAFKLLCKLIRIYATPQRSAAEIRG